MLSLPSPAPQPSHGSHATYSLCQKMVGSASSPLERIRETATGKRTSGASGASRRTQKNASRRTQKKSRRTQKKKGATGITTVALFGCGHLPASANGLEPFDMYDIIERLTFRLCALEAG